MSMVGTDHVTFDLPDRAAATEPPEARGLTRDEVRLLVAKDDRLEHARFKHLAGFLEPGDLVVVNTSATISAAIDATRAGRDVVVHFSAPLDDGTWAIELRSAGGARPLMDAEAGERIEIAGGGALKVVASYPEQGSRSRLVRARARLDEPVEALLARFGRPITYGHLHDRWPLPVYQTVFGRTAGSAEMPSAGRPFTDAIVTEFITRGIGVAPILLHAGVSSLEASESPLPERLSVPPVTARLVNHTRRHGGRIVAVGTTVTRALESAVRPDGTVAAAHGWTDLVLSPSRPARVVDGLVTGWHPPEASHLMLLEAVAGTALVQEAYDEALAAGYLWHEFGDSCLFLPERKDHLNRPRRAAPRREKAGGPLSPKLHKT